MMWTSQYLAPIILVWPAIFQLGSTAAITHRDLQPFVWNSNGGFTMAADSGCTDKNPHNPKETKYDFLYRGFAGASELSQVTWDRFNKNTYSELKKGPPDEKKQKEVDAKDPAYTQFFAMDWSSEGLEKIHNTLRKVQAFNSDPGKDGRPKDGSGIEVSCKSKYEVDGLDWCNRPNGFKPYAWLHNKPDDNKGNKQGSILNVCDSFFALPDFDTRKKASEATYKEDSFTIDDWNAVRSLPYFSGTQAMGIFHELTHVWWIGPTNPVKGTPDSYEQNPPEIYGAYWNGKEASKCLKDNKNCNQNADSFANYAEVGYFQGKYGASLWPADGTWKKPISLPITPGKSQHTG